MLGELVSPSFVDIVSEETSPDGSSHKVLFRVKNSSVWNKTILKILKAQENSDFGASVRKEYFLRDGVPTFTWVLLFWGDLVSALEALEGIFSEPVPAPKVAPKKAKTSIELSRTKTDTPEGQRVITTVPLPHYKGPRRTDPTAIKTLGSKMFGATVSSIKESSGL